MKNDEQTAVGKHKKLMPAQHFKPLQSKSFKLLMCPLQVMMSTVVDMVVFERALRENTFAVAILPHVIL